MTKERKQFKQIQNQSQEGRSMVEMLGVLSIGGIVGYRMAMNHYQANQIAHEINLMRTDAKVKIAQGMTKLLLGSPYDDEKHLNFNANYGVQVDFPVTITDETGENKEDGYSFTLSGIPAGVCKPLATLLDGMDDTASLKINEGYYDDETTENKCEEEEENDIEVVFSTENFGVPGSESGGEENAPECNETTCPGGTCNEDGVCECPGANEHWTGTGCVACDESTGGTWENGKCNCPEGKLLSSDGKCIDHVCSNWNDCPDDVAGNPQYCDMYIPSCINGNPILGSSGHRCEKVEGYYTKIKIKNSAGDTKTIYKSMKTMDWWAAGAFCQALGRKLSKTGMHLVSLSDLECTTSSCPVGSYGKLLADQTGSGSGWTSTPYNNDNTSCDAYFVYLTTGNVSSNSRNLGYDDTYGCALCE